MSIRIHTCLLHTCLNETSEETEKGKKKFQQIAFDARNTLP